MNIYAIQRPFKITEQEIQKYLIKIPTDRQEKVKKFLTKKDAIQSLCSSLLLKYVVQKELTGCDIVISYNQNGKPYFDEFPEFHFNISHSYNWIICVTDNIQVGVDIEKIKEIDLEIAKEFFTATEYTNIKKRPFLQQLPCFYEYWTMKEAYLKNIGKGLSIPLNSFTISEENGKYITIDKYQNIYFFNQLYLDNEYKLSICSEKNVLEPKIQFVNFKEFDSI